MHVTVTRERAAVDFSQELVLAEEYLWRDVLEAVVEMGPADALQALQEPEAPEPPPPPVRRKRARATTAPASSTTAGPNSGPDWS